MTAYDEDYVREILAAARSKKIQTKRDFDEMTVRDVNAGYRAEANEAFKRLTMARSREGRKDEAEIRKLFWVMKGPFPWEAARDELEHAVDELRIVAASEVPEEAAAARKSALQAAVKLKVELDSIVKSSPDLLPRLAAHTKKQRSWSVEDRLQRFMTDLEDLKTILEQKPLASPFAPLMEAAFQILGDVHQRFVPDRKHKLPLFVHSVITKHGISDVKLKTVQNFWSKNSRGTLSN